MSGALDLKLRSERVEMDVHNTKGNLLPGMVAEVLLPLNAKDSTFVVPKSALVNSAEGIVCDQSNQPQSNKSRCEKRKRNR